jgi:hypothetical protein
MKQKRGRIPMGKIHYIKSMTNLSVINQIHFYKEGRERRMYRWGVVRLLPCYLKAKLPMIR